MFFRISLFTLFSSVVAYDYYSLAVQNWCQVKKQDKNQQIYNIHGLWPDNYPPKTFPQNCSAPAYNPDMSDDLVSDMKKYWYDCNEEQTLSLWEHEYTKHGSCVYEQTGITQSEYFEKVIELFQMYNTNSTICFDLNFNKISCTSHIDKIE